MTVRKYSSISQDTTLATSINAVATSLTVAAGTGASLLGGITLSAGDIFTIAVDVDTINEEIMYVTARTGDVLTVTRAQAGSSATTHSSGATIQHVLSSSDLNWFNNMIQSNSAIGTTPTLDGNSNQVQVRRATAATWTSTNPTLAAGEIGFETDTNKFKIGTGSAVWTALSYGAGSFTSITAGTGLSGGTITTSGTIAIDSTVATLTGAQTLTNKTFLSPEERTTVSATAATGTVNFDVVTQGFLYYTTNASGNWTLNIRGNSGTTLSSLLAVGDSVTVAFLVTNGSTAYYQTAFNIDGVSVTPKYTGGTAPSAGNASSIDVYTYTIIKTAATPTYTVFGAGPIKYA